MKHLAALDDGTLIQQILAGHSESFMVLMHRHQPAVRKLALSMMRNASDADDVVQTTFLKAWLRLSSFRADASFRAWIMRVASNEVFQQFRSSKRRSSVGLPIGLDNFTSNEESPHEALARLEVCALLRTEIEKLPPKYRQVVTLCDLDGLTVGEAAESLQSQTSRMKTRLFRGRQMLTASMRKRLDRATSTSSPLPIAA